MLPQARKSHERREDDHSSFNLYSLWERNCLRMRRYCEEMPPELLAERWMLRDIVKEMSELLQDLKRHSFNPFNEIMTTCI